MVYLAVDCGTTNSSVFLLKDHRILRRIDQPVGVRTTSISGNRTLLHATLRRTLQSLSRAASSPPRFTLAAGMITSSLGLMEIPHVVAPARAEQLSQRVRRKTFPHISPVPFFLVPGVRVGAPPCQLRNVEESDIIRGEETEIVGLLATRKLARPWLFLHLGSHAKAIAIDAGGRIVGSVSTLSGECLQLLCTQTILADQLGRLRSRRIRRTFLLEGARTAKRVGLLRALFLVRLLGENSCYDSADLYSFLLGAVLCSDLRGFESNGLLGGRKILLSGNPQLIRAWKTILRTKKLPAEGIHPSERVAAFLAGLRRIVFPSPAFQRFAAREGLGVPAS